MFDVGISELMMIVIVAVVVIGPKDMPLAMRTAGRWIGKMRKISGHFRAGIDAMVREAELEDMEKKWREQNEAIMKASPQLPSSTDMAAPSGEANPDDANPDDANPDKAKLPEEKPVSAVATGEAEAAVDDPVSQESTPRQAEMHLPPPPP